MSLLFAATSTADFREQNNDFSPETSVFSLGPFVNEGFRWSASANFPLIAAAEGVALPPAFWSSFCWNGNILTGGDDYGLIFRDAAGELLLQIYAINSGRVAFRRRNAAGTIVTHQQTTGTGISSTGVNRLDFETRLTEDGRLAGYLNRNVIFEVAGDFRLPPGAQMVEVSVGPFWGNRSMSALFGCTEPSIEADFVQRRPIAPGSLAQWDGTFASVNSLGVDDLTQLVTANDTDHRHSFGLSNLSAFSDREVIGVAASMRARSGVDTSAAIGPFLRVGSTNVDIGTHDFETTPQPSVFLSSINPSTGNPWTITELTTAQLGVRVGPSS